MLPPRGLAAQRPVCRKHLTQITAVLALTANSSAASRSSTFDLRNHSLPHLPRIGLWDRPASQKPTNADSLSHPRPHENPPDSIGAEHALVVYGEPTLEKALKSVGFLWQARSGTRVNVFLAPTDLSYAQIDRGARCDVIFALAGAATEEAARAKIIHAATISRALRNGLVLVGTERGSAPIADASLTDISRLIAGKRLAIANPDRDPAGARAVELLRMIGMVADDGNKAVTVAEST